MKSMLGCRRASIFICLRIKPMTERKRMQLTSLWAACLLMIFLFGWLGAPLRFAFPENPSCSMECCLTNGYCSCRMSPSGTGADDDHDHLDFVWSTEEVAPQRGEMTSIMLGSPCPEKCAQVPSEIRIFAAHRSGSSGQSTEFSLSLLIKGYTPIFMYGAFYALECSPRAPPTSKA